MLGPLIRAVVGDTIRVVFRNNGPRPFSMHPHGVFYDKRSEGAPYKDGGSAADSVDDRVPPGGTHIYIWPVPERAGPTAHEGSSGFWMYHSHTVETKDVNSGLVGPMIITAADRARDDGTPNDVDREIIAAFHEIDENDSWFFDENLTKYASQPESVTMDEKLNIASGFFLSNLRETINGWSFGHTPLFRLRVGERVRWYTMGATNFEIHAPHWHGNTVVANGMRTDVTALLPMSMLIADMVPDNPGTWLIHCHVAPHLNAGMQARFVVEPAERATR
jgi:hephaestin